MLACCSLACCWTVGWRGRCSWAPFHLPLCISLSLAAVSKVCSQSCRAKSTKWLRTFAVTLGWTEGAAAHGLNQVLGALGKLWLKRNSSQSWTLARQRERNGNLCQMNAQKNMKIWSEHRLVWINNLFHDMSSRISCWNMGWAISRSIARLDSCWAELTRYLDFS